MKPNLKCIFPYLLKATIILTIAACAPAKKSAVTLGEASPEQLTQIKGPPDHQVESNLLIGASLYQYSDQTQYQIEEGKVTGFFRPPEGDEVNLQYWRHQWEGKNAEYLEMPNSKDAHGRSLFELKSDQEKKAVIYDPSKEKVIRVIEYRDVPDDAAKAPVEEGAK